MSGDNGIRKDWNEWSEWGEWSEWSDGMSKEIIDEWGVSEWSAWCGEWSK